jgi:hypothetical protein
MVVVDNARKLIGKTTDIAVTSVLQTTAGKMIFGRLWEEVESENNDTGFGIHDSRTPGFRQAKREMRQTTATHQID